MADDSFKDFVLDQLNGLAGFECRRMFGGYGFYQSATFFGILFRDRLYFKTSEATREKYLKQGAGPFLYEKRDKKTGAKKTVGLKNYYEVPVEILEDRAELSLWACESSQVTVQLGAKK